MTTLRGKVSWFGGPEDHGVAPDEGLAFIYSVEDAPYLFLPQQPPGTTGLARRLDPEVHFIACRWDYSQTPKKMLPGMMVEVYAPRTGRAFKAWPADWGPHESTGRVADISSGLMQSLGIITDDIVEVTFLAQEPEELEDVVTYQTIVISSGHSTKCQGAVGIINEVTEATKVSDRVALEMEKRGAEVSVFHDTKSTTQSANLNAIVNYHNARERQLDVSVHFNAYQTTSKPMGTEVLYVTQEALARELSAAIAKAGGFIDRGPKKRTDLAFLNNTEEPAVLLEICFVDSSADVELYRKNFDRICEAIADVLCGVEEEEIVPKPEPPKPEPGELVVSITVEAPPGVRVVVRTVDS
jgi:N-acetylmuramoyl-L-alanine amidase